MPEADHTVILLMGQSVYFLEAVCVSNKTEDNPSIKYAFVGDKNILPGLPVDDLWKLPEFLVSLVQIEELLDIADKAIHPSHYVNSVGRCMTES